MYQQIMDISDLDKLGKWLVAECEKAQAFRETNKLKEMSLILSGIPIQEYQLIGQFYQGYTGVSQNPHKIFENVIEKSKTYKSIALIALATLELQAGNCDSGIQFCNEAIRYTRNASTMMHAARSIAVIKSVEGFHTTALKDLGEIAPLARYVSPVAGYQYYNSCAVELAEVGRLEEARNISNIVLASPYANAYPEWRETSDDIERKGYRSSRSFLPIIQGATQLNIVRLPERENIPVSQGEPGRVLHYDWEAMVKKRNNDSDEAIDAMDEKELLVKLIQLTALEDVDRNKLCRIVKFAVKVMTEQNKK